MASAKILRPAELGHPPAALKEPHAAAYLGISVTKLRSLEDGPPARRIDSVKVYLREDLDAWARSLPTDDELQQVDEEKECDEVFG